MAGGQEGHYDDSAFAYFALAVVVLILIVSTISYVKTWRASLVAPMKGDCSCEGCVEKADQLKKKAKKPSKWAIIKFILYILVWIFFIYLLQRAAVAGTVETVAFDPFQILELDAGASAEEIKKSYRKLSLKYHPDKNPDPDSQERYISIAKAYNTLTDPEVKEKWEKYGNPDGPQGFSVGIALPSFLVDSKNSLAVLGLYVVCLAIIFPVVAIWYWQSQKDVAHNKVLNKTIGFFYHRISEIRRFKFLMIVLCCAAEYVEAIPARQTDNITLAAIKSEIPDVISEVDKTFGKQEKKEKKDKKAGKQAPQVVNPLQNFVVKHMMLFYGHFSRQFQRMSAVKGDVDALVLDAPRLLVCMIEICAIPQRRFLTPVLEAIQMAQMIVQAVWSKGVRVEGQDTHFLQLPHFTKDMQLKLQKKKRITEILQFCQLKPEDRSQFLTEEGLLPNQIQDVENVIKVMPHDLSMTWRCEVDEDDDSVGITGGSFVTFIATFSRPSKPTKAQPEIKKDVDEVYSDEEDEVVDQKKDENNTFVKKRSGKRSLDDPFKVQIGKEEEYIEAHAPYFPTVRHEMWWVLLADDRTNRFIGITKVAAMRHNAEAKILFRAPLKPGTYNWTIHLLCDSYVGFDSTYPFTMRVAKEIPPEKLAPIQEEEEEQAEDDVPADDDAIDDE